MAEVTNRNLANSRLMVGQTPAQLKRVRGTSAEGITISPVQDTGGIMIGTQGDSMVWSMPEGGKTITVNSLPASRSIKQILNGAANGPGAFAYDDGDYSISGTYVVQNSGDVTSTNTARAIVMACALTKNSNEAVGTVVQAQ